MALARCNDEYPTVDRIVGMCWSRNLVNVYAKLVNVYRYTNTAANSKAQMVLSHLQLHTRWPKKIGTMFCTL